MDRLWTPWRFEYIRRLDSTAPDACVFCDLLVDGRDADNLVLHRGSHCYVVLNLFPYTTGHVLVVANRHFGRLGDASSQELAAFMDLAQRSERALQAEYRPDGYNVGFNLGRSAGAGVAHHIHMHVLPRWAGDANFVSVLGETRVLPEELPRTYQRLHPHFL